MSIQAPRDPWRMAWQIATGDSALTVLLLCIAAGLMLSVWLPQTPFGDPMAYARWLSDMQARYGSLGQVMRLLGLFTITQSFGFRALVALLAGVLLLRLIDCGERLFGGSDRPAFFKHSCSPRLLAHAGALLLLGALLMTHLWGWQVEAVILQAGDRMPIGNASGWIALTSDDLTVTHSSGVIPTVQERGPGVRVSAADSAGNSLPLQLSGDAEPRPELTLALNEDRYFAIPDSQLVIQIGPQPDLPADPLAPILIQVYRSPPGRLENTTTIASDGQLAIDDVTLHLASVPYAKLTVTSNPGFWPTTLGLALMLIGVGWSVIQSISIRSESESEER